MIGVGRPILSKREMSAALKRKPSLQTRRLRHVYRSGHEYVIRVKYSTKALKRSGVSIAPNQGHLFNVGTSMFALINGGMFTHAHVSIKRVK